jgi:hypothetical protein
MLLLLIERCLRRTRITPTRFGRAALGDLNLVQQLRSGRELRPQTAQRIVAYLEVKGEQL